MTVASAVPFPPERLGFTLTDLHDPARLAELDRLFRQGLAAEDAALSARYEAYRSGEALGAVAESSLIVEVARPLSRFLAHLFDVEDEREALIARDTGDAVLFKFRWWVFQKRTVKKFPTKESVEALDASQVDARGNALLDLLAPGDADPEKRVAAAGFELFVLAGSLATPRGKEAAYTAEEAVARIEALRPRAAERDLPADGEPAALVARWAEHFDAHAARLYHVEKARTRHWASFFVPKPFKFDKLVETSRPLPVLPEARVGPHHRPRAGFALTDPRKTRREVTGETHYCLLCHEREKDSCSRGFRQKDGRFKENPLGVALRGCPLDEKISEMHVLRREGDSIGALALVTIDNPMCPGTGHRICNDCMKGCIFQVQDPVDIPQAETGILTDVFSMPWGFEIWSLMTRWDPLNKRRPVALPYNGKNVLVVGLGPSGYTLAHHLVNEGFGVAAVDGLKIEPLPEELVGGQGRPPAPIRDVSTLMKRLDERPLAGFGGVSEYGITVRWDKNFLDLIYVNLARRELLKVYGGVRFGGTVTMEQAFDMGFDHVAIAAGAGKPTIVEFRNNLIKGVRKASDFLMALQLTGAFKAEGLANLHVDLPVIVIGGGLTAIDTATEALAYYPLLAEKMLDRFEALSQDSGEKLFFTTFNAEEKQILARLVEHGGAVRAERRRAEVAGETPDFARLCKEWGGSTIAYRRSMEESPAYRLNHEEIAKALEEGLVFAENLDPVEAVPDEFGRIRAMIFRRKDGTTVELPCRTLLVAAGTTPNTIYGREHPGSVPLDAKRKFFLPHVAVKGEDGVFRPHPKPDGDGAFFTGVSYKGKLASYFGDNHPVYAGSVVKAMASGKDGAPKIFELFGEDLAALERERGAEDGASRQRERDAAWRAFGTTLDDLLIARVARVVRLTPTIVEVVVKAPLAARNFHPGQFYRLQNYEAYAPKAWGALDVRGSGQGGGNAGGLATPLLIEPCALTGAWVDPEQGLLSMIALEIGVSSRLCGALTEGEPVVVMGPTGTATELPENETVILCGGGLGNAVLFSIGKEARRRGNKVIYFAGYKKAEDFYKREDIEAGADVVVYSVDVPPHIPKHRTQDREFVGNIVQSMLAYAEGTFGAMPVPLSDATRMIVIGSDRMMAAVAAARHGVLKPHLSADHVGIGSINSPMQCMMKEVCAQCLQRHVDPVTQKESFVFSCFNQDQKLDEMDWRNLRARLDQNSVEEKISGMWLDRLLRTSPVARV